MPAENLAYALSQVAHNFGAAAVLGGAWFALWPAVRLEAWRRHAWLILAGWLTQIASGGAFGLVSLHFYGATPDLGHVALAALAVKVTTAAGGTLLAAALLRYGATWAGQRIRRTFRALLLLAAVALAAAAFLRWFS